MPRSTDTSPNPAPSRLRASTRAGTLLRAVAHRIRRPVASQHYSPEIDGLRFIAIAVVVVGHFMERAVRFFPSAQDALVGHPVGELLLRPGLGVYLFFTISGFIIARQAMKGDAAPLSPAFLKAYFGRRVLRIEPPYVILLVATFLLLSVGGYRPDQTHHFDAVPNSLGVSLVGSIFYVHDLVWGTYPRLFPPGWSLEIEVQFYVLAPLLFWAFLKCRSVGAKAALGAFGLFGGALLSLTAPSRIGGLHTQMSLLQFLHFFWLGILLAHLHGWILARTERMPARLASALGWAGLACYLVIPMAPKDDLVVAMAIRGATLASLVAMFVSAFVRGSSFSAFCARPWVSLIGGACYSIYLTHLQVIQAITSVLAKLMPHPGFPLVALYGIVEIAAVLVIGMVFYALIERPFMIRDWPDRLRRRLGIWCRGLVHAHPVRGLLRERH